MKNKSSLNQLSSPSYPILFEYARELVVAFIEGELSIYKTHPENIFDTSSFHSSFFNFNVHLLSNETVMSAAKKIFCPSISRTESMEQFARVERLYTTLVCACGKEFIAELLNNASASVSKDDKKIHAFFEEHPTVIISLIGGPYFGEKQIQYIRKREFDSQKSNRSGTNRIPMIG